MKCPPTEHEEPRPHWMRPKRRLRLQQQSPQNRLRRDRLFQAPKNKSLCASIAMFLITSKSPGRVGKIGSMARCDGRPGSDLLRPGRRQFSFPRSKSREWFEKEQRRVCATQYCDAGARGGTSRLRMPIALNMLPADAVASTAEALGVLISFAARRRRPLGAARRRNPLRWSAAD